MKKGLIVLFPGIRYSTDCPLLYYAGAKYKDRGYEVLEIKGYGLDDRKYSFEEFSEKARKSVREQLQTTDFSQYREVVFAAKSMGTVLALWAEEYFELSHVVHVLLTPINLTLSLLDETKKVRFIVSGTADKMIDAGKLRAVCEKYHFPLRMIKHVGHGLEMPGNVYKSIDILKAVVKQM